MTLNIKAKETKKTKHIHTTLTIWYSTNFNLVNQEPKLHMIQITASEGEIKFKHGIDQKVEKKIPLWGTAMINSKDKCWEG